MAKVEKSKKTKITVSFRIDPDLHKDAVVQCMREGVAKKERINFSKKMEELVAEWLGKKVEGYAYGNLVDLLASHAT
jgi:hypothetical protein